jgi:tRNA(adenine34) deaminase
MSPEALADSLASKTVSPQGPESGMRLLRFYISHSNKRLGSSRLRKLEKAQQLLAARIARDLKAQARKAA